jgi:hypothetical protein
MYFGSYLKAMVFKIAYNWNIIVILVFWTSVLTFMTLVDIGGDLMFLAKRLGRIPAVCLPTVLFLTLRPSPLPQILYLGLLPIHKWLSRLIIVQSLLHTGLYVGYFRYKHSWHKMWKLENVFGWVALLGFLVIIVTSILNLRNGFYRFFYVNHYFWSWVIVLCLQHHIRPQKYSWYTLINGSILVWQIVYRLWLTRLTLSEHDVLVTQASPNLSLIEFPREMLYKIPVNPAAHIRLTDYHRNPVVRVFKQMFPIYHPYTLVLLPNDPIQKLIVRMESYKLKNNQKYLITGSYDPHLHFIHSTSQKFNISKLKIDAKRLLVVVGGSAISFALPLLRVMNYHGIDIKIVWVIRDFRDVLILKNFSQFISPNDFEIFITSEPKLQKKKSFVFTKDIEAQEPNDYSLTLENEVENVEVDVDVEEDVDDPKECFTPTIENKRSMYTMNTQGEGYGSINEISFNKNIFSDGDETTGLTENVSSNEGHSNDPITDSMPLIRKNSRSYSQKTSVSMNDPFVASYIHDSEESKAYLESYSATITELGLDHKVYKGRPKLNHRYLNWCLREGFTQCSGPVEGDDGDLICCRDVPQNKTLSTIVDTKKIWVVSAGPKGLVNNVKVWATENGLNFHEEAFYV